MRNTHSFKMNLPEMSDPVDVRELNDNFLVIDDALMAGLCKKELTTNNMGSSDPASRKYGWAPWIEIYNGNEFDVVVIDRNAPDLPSGTINIEAGGTYRMFINGTYYMNFYVQDQHDVTFKWFTNAETRINEIEPSGGGGVSSVNVIGGSGSHLETSGGPVIDNGTIEINLSEGYSIPQINKQTAWDSKAADLKLEINSSTFVITAQLKDASGNLIGNERTIDLPLETMVVDGEYDSQTQKIKLELKNGNYVEFSVADLVSGLQTELSASNKLDPDYIDYDADHRAVSDTEKNTWSGKQNALTFDDTPTQNSNNPVKSGGIYTALAGKQASLDNTQLAAVNSGIDSTKVAQISTNQTNILYTLGRTGRNLYNSEDCVINTRLDSHGKDFYDLGYQTSNYIPISNISALVRNVDFSLMLSLCEYDENKNFISRTPDGSGSRVSLNANTKYVRTTLLTSHTNVLLCSADDWDVSHEYTPYRGLPNYDLTVREAEDRAALAEVVDEGAKNRFDYDTVTIASDGFVIPVTTPMILAEGSYEISYTANQSESGNVEIGFLDADRQVIVSRTLLSKSGRNKAVLTIPTSKTSAYIYMYSAEGGTFSDFMVCTEAKYDISPNYAPFALPNTDLTRMMTPFFTVPINHNMIYRGQNLGDTLTADQDTALSSGNFTDLYLGDYWTKQITIPAFYEVTTAEPADWSTNYTSYYTKSGDTYTPVTGDTAPTWAANTYYKRLVPSQTVTLKAVIADFDTFYAGYASGYAAINTHHAAVIVTGFSNVVWNKTNSTAGGYVNSLIHKWLVGSALPQIETWFGSAKVLSHQKLLTNVITGDAASGWAWSSQKISLLSENQMFGSKVWGNSKAANGGYEPGEAFKHLNVFNHIDANLLFGNRNIWLRDIASAERSASLYSDGAAGYYAASDTWFAPAALILLS